MPIRGELIGQMKGMVKGPMDARKGIRKEENLFNVRRGACVAVQSLSQRIP